MLTIISLVTIIIGSFIFITAKPEKANIITGNAINEGNAEFQKITLSVKDYNYYPNTIKVKSGAPVELTLDKSVSGCLRSFTIKELDVAKNSRSPEDKIKFTPTKTGSFRFACSMGMGYGTIIVE